MASTRLLTLSPERLEQEKRFVAWAAQEAREERRRARAALLGAAAWLTAGYSLLAFSVWTKDPETGAVAFWAALAAGNIGPVATGFHFWSHART
jgi:hypothetical protein